jgi:hypothetical protein
VNFFHGIPWTFQANALTVPKIRLRLLLSIFLQIDYSLIILSFDDAQAMLLTVLLDKLSENQTYFYRGSFVCEVGATGMF